MCCCIGDLRIKTSQWGKSKTQQKLLKLRVKMWNQILLESKGQTASRIQTLDIAVRSLIEKLCIKTSFHICEMEKRKSSLTDESRMNNIRKFYQSDSQSFSLKEQNEQNLMMCKLSDCKQNKIFIKYFTKIFYDELSLLKLLKLW